MNDVIDKYFDLLTKLRIAFEKSDIKRYAEINGNGWSFGLSSTKPIMNSPLILGFNWGANKSDEPYEEQKTIPQYSFAELAELGWLSSLKRSVPYLERYVPGYELKQYNQSNICLFRSKNEKQISKNDIKLSLPVLLEYIEWINPPEIICFSRSAKEWLHAFCLLESVTSSQPIKINSKGHITYSFKANLKAGKKQFKIAFLPHPAANILNRARKECWDYCFT